MDSIRILIANKYFLMNYAIKCILQPIENFKVFGVPGNEIVSGIERFNPHLLIVEIDASKQDSFNLLSQIREKFPLLKIMALLDFDDKENLFGLLQFKLEGYLLKNTSREELIRAAKDIYNGRNYISAEINYFIFDRLNEPLVNGKGKKYTEILSDRELEILQLIVKGKNNGEIAAGLFISEKTVLTHRRNIMRKLKVRNSAQLILAGIKNGIVPVND